MVAELDIDLDIAADAWRANCAEIEDIVGRAARAACESFAALPDRAELSIVLGDDSLISELNLEWRGKSGATNVLSFPAQDPGAPGRPRHFGDVVLAVETIAREADEQGKTFDHHVAHLVVHGVLHLLGYDHETDADAADMERLEVAALGRLGVPDPYRSAEPAAE